MTSILIVGAGQAGVQTAVSLRELGFDGEVTVVGAESHAPYQRPPLSKAFLTGASDAEALELRSPAFYADHRIDIVTGERVERVDHDGPGGKATTDTGRTLRYDQLVLATGVRSRGLPVAGADAKGVQFLRTLDEAAALRDELDDLTARGGDVVIIGAGFIGLEIAAACRKRGIGVTVVELGDRVLARAISPEMSAALTQAHTAQGTRLLLRSSVDEVLTDSDGRVCGVRTSDGEVITCQAVVVGIGSVARIELADQLGIDVSGGILVDEGCRTSLDGVVAVGDCTVFCPSWADGPVRMESVPSAIEQGRIAAATLLGLGSPPQAHPWFWSDQGDLHLQIAGWTSGADVRVVRANDQPDKVSVVCFRGGELVGIEALNSPHDLNAVKRALAHGRSLTPEQAAHLATPLKQMLT